MVDKLTEVKGVVYCTKALLLICMQAQACVCKTPGPSPCLHAGLRAAYTKALTLIMHA